MYDVQKLLAQYLANDSFPWWIDMHILYICMHVCEYVMNTIICGVRHNNTTTSKHMYVCMWVCDEYHYLWCSPHQHHDYQCMWWIPLLVVFATPTPRLAIIENKLHTCINNVIKWTNENGFTFSKAKTRAILVTILPGLHLLRNIELNGTTISYEDCFKLLGWYLTVNWPGVHRYIKE